jgi:hypothetical protein
LQALLVSGHRPTAVRAVGRNPGGAPRVLEGQHAIRVALGLIWLADGALQFQPFVFGRGCNKGCRAFTFFVSPAVKFLRR